MPSTDSQAPLATPEQGRERWLNRRRRIRLKNGPADWTPDNLSLVPPLRPSFQLIIGYRGSVAVEEVIDRHTWERAMEHLRAGVDEESFSTWIRPAQFRDFSRGCLVLAVPNLISKNWIWAHYRDRIIAAVRAVTHRDVELEIQIIEHPDASTPAPSAAGGAIPAANAETPGAEMALSTPRPNTLNQRYRFEDFVVGENNRFAHAASRQVADPASKSYNPLFIYGGVGLGKTHLMHAIGHQLLSVSPTSRVLYVTSEQFMNSFIEAISQGRQFEFRDFYRNVDLLMIDDVQFFSGKERTQTEFFHTFNALYDAGRKIVVSSDRPPRELTTLEDRLRNRFSWGLVVDIQPPDLETRIAILKKKAMADGTEIPNDVTTYIAERVPSNIRELEGVLIRLKAYASLHRQPISLELAERILGHLLVSEAPRSIDLDTIIEEVCNYFDISRAELTGTSRLKRFSGPRHIAQYLARRLTSLSYPEIAARFGGRDHTSVLHAFRKIEEEQARDENLKSLLGYLTKKIQEQHNR
jgi:chromosomal replication initiator protein